MRKKNNQKDLIIRKCMLYYFATICSVIARLLLIHVQFVPPGSCRILRMTDTKSMCLLKHSPNCFHMHTGTCSSVLVYNLLNLFNVRLCCRGIFRGVKGSITTIHFIYVSRLLCSIHCLLCFESFCFFNWQVWCIVRCWCLN